MPYTRDMHDLHIALVKRAQGILSRRVAGGSGIELEVFARDYWMIAKLFDPNTQMIKSVGMMFADILMDAPLPGFKCLEYEQLLKLVVKKIKSKVFFRRKKEIICLKLNEHIQPCYCSRLAAAQARKRVM